MNEKPKPRPAPKVGGSLPTGVVKGSVPRMENPPPPPPKPKPDSGK